MPEKNSTPGPQSLISKLAEACNAIGGIEKKGKNESQKYSYVKAADVAKAIRREFFKRQIVLTFDEKEFTQLRTLTTFKGGEIGEFLLKGEFTFHDGQSGETLGPFGAFGVAMDSGDKAIYKCKTGALKYMLREIGLIPDEKDDPEADEKVDKAVKDGAFQAEYDAKTEGQRRILPHQVNGILDACKRTGKAAVHISAYLADLGLVQLEELTRDDFNPMIKWANSLIIPKDNTDLVAPLQKTIDMKKKQVRRGPQPIAVMQDHVAADEVDVAGD